DILVQTSKSESIGRVLVESMKLGLVCVGSDIAGSNEAFKLGGGTTYESGNVKNLALVLDKILSSFESYKQKALVSQQKALKNLSIDACHEPFFLELGKVIDQPNPRREMRHMVSLFKETGLMKKGYNETLMNLRTSMGQTDEHLQNIIKSRTWKTIVLLRKTLRR